MAVAGREVAYHPAAFGAGGSGSSFAPGQGVSRLIMFQSPCYADSTSGSLSSAARIAAGSV